MAEEFDPREIRGSEPQRPFPAADVKGHTVARALDAFEDRLDALLPGPELAVHRDGESGRVRAAGCRRRDRKSTRLNSSHSQNSYAVFCLKKKKACGVLPRARSLAGSSGT